MPLWHKPLMPYLDLKALKAARDAKGWTQYDLADRLDVKQPTVGRWETGEREPKTLEMLVRLCDVLEVSSDYLLGRRDMTVDREGASSAPINVEALAEILDAVVNDALPSPLSAEEIRRIAAEVHELVREIDNDESLNTPEARRAYLKGSRRRRPLRQQPEA